jgi:uncharacterized LabA/DUF88 family protein
MNKLRAIQFIDGENLVARFQAMAEAGHTPKASVEHQKDVFVWHDGMSKFFERGFTRINYYASVVGDDAEIARVKCRLAAIQYRYDPMLSGGPMLQLVPTVFKKPARSKKTNNVDLQITIDLMRSLHSTDFDVLFLVTGDGDYLPLVQEAMRAGKMVTLAALSSGLNSALPSAVSKFYQLDEVFFNAP